MSYAPLNLAPSCPPAVEKFIVASVELTFRDVHAMLRLPRPDDGLEAGCNFSIARVLLDVISGVSTIFYDSALPSRTRFVRCLQECYPWALEHDYRRYPECMKPAPASAMLYDLFRNPFSHALGLDTKIAGGTRRSTKVVRVVRSKPFRIGVGRIVSIGSGYGLSPSLLRELERGKIRPDWVPCTLEKEDDGYTLSTEALYTGVRRMVESMSGEERFATHAAAMLA
jgi:hypothetical protein